MSMANFSYFRLILDVCSAFAFRGSHKLNRKPLGADFVAVVINGVLWQRTANCIIVTVASFDT